MSRITRTISVFGAFAFVGSASSFADTTAPRIAEKDLAIAFSLEGSHLLPASFQGSLANPLLPASWIEQVSAAFGETSVGGALDEENQYSDWKLISVRVAPCAPLHSFPTKFANSACWPEVRLVWQPVLTPFQHLARTVPAYADDRAIHAIYRVDPGVALSAQDALAARKLRESISNASPGADGNIEAFVKYRNAVVRQLLTDVIALRAANEPISAFEGLGVRPESTDRQNAKSFRDNVGTFLAKFAQTPSLVQLTAFSLPAGREPALLDEWVFVSFKGTGTDIEPENILLQSARDGRVLVDFGRSITATQRRDDERLYDELATASAIDGKEIQSAALLFETERDSLRGPIADRTVLHVNNVTCTSCHKFNEERFNFHNFSYLENRTLSIAPRVERDVALDLDWLATSLR